MRRLLGSPRLARLLLSAATVVVGLTACENDDTTAPGGGTGGGGPQAAVIVNSIDVSVTVFDTRAPENIRTIGLAPAGSPITGAARKNLAIVPLGFFPAVAVVDLSTDSVSTIPLPINSGATGAAFLNDSIAYVANPNLNSVSRLNVFRDTADTEIPVGVFPQAIITSLSLVFVLNAELDATFQPAREGRISVIEPLNNAVMSVIGLSGFNPSAAAFGPDGMLYVVNSGAFGQGNGSLSVVDPANLREVEHHAGFGEFPRDIAFDAAGRAYVSSFNYGIAVWDAVADTFIQPPADPLVVEGNSISSGVAFDSDDRLYTLIPGDCNAPSVVLRLKPDLSFDNQFDVGVCPIDILLADLVP